MPKPDEGLIVVRLIDEARRKSDGSTPGMVAWLERHKEFMVVDADTRYHDKALDFLALDNEVVLTPPLIVKGPELKTGMEVEAHRDYTVTLTKDAYVDPKDNKLTIEGTRSDNGQPWCAAIDATSSYFVTQRAELGRGTDTGLGMGL
jgi:hypothetical protein